MRAQAQASATELAQLREGIKQVMQTDASGAPQSAHFAKILEAQSNELCKLRRLLDEHQLRERTCQRKWNALLKENIQLQ